VTVAIDTPRLALRHMTDADAEFMLTLLNDPDFLRYIGDRGVRTLEDARGYIERGPVASYARFGFGLYVVERKGTGEWLGICGILKRDELPEPDIGFAFLPAYRSQGFALEAAQATCAFARDTLNLPRLLAITSVANTRSIRLLEKLGFRFERLVQLSPGGTPSNLFVADLRLIAHP
jgi:[ribosomal protein S5]-alanine N-acetyltransferase